MEQGVGCRPVLRHARCLAFRAAADLPEDSGGIVRLAGGIGRVARAAACVLAALAMGGCVASVAEVIRPDAEPGSEYHDGYMAGVEFADDAWFDKGMAAEWLDINALTVTDFEIQKALNNLPAEAVQNHSTVWVEAFRAGASTRFDQYRVATRKASARTSQWLATGIVALVVPLVVMGRLAAR